MKEAPVRYIVLDTNVPVTANKLNSKGSEKLVECIEACIKAIGKIINGEGLVLILDKENKIFEEYLRNLRCTYKKVNGKKKQAQIGTEFFLWLCKRRFDENYVKQVAIRRNGEESYFRFPKHSGLNNFDEDDKKFIAVANVHPEKTTILEGTDRAWLKFEDPLKQAGINVKFLCRGYLKELEERKQACTQICSKKKN